MAIKPLANWLIKKTPNSQSSGRLQGDDKVGQIILGMLQDTAALLKALPQPEAFKRMTSTGFRKRAILVLLLHQC